MRRLIPIAKLSVETEIPVRTLRTLAYSRKIPFLKFGHRTVLFDRAEVERALARFEIPAIEANK